MANFNFDKVKNTLTQIWRDKNNDKKTERQIVFAIYHKKKREKSMVYDELDSDVKGSLVSSKMAKQGIFYEDMVFELATSCLDITLLDGCEGHMKNEYKVNMPKSLFENIDALCAEIRETSSLLQAEGYLDRKVKELFEKAKRARRPSEQKENKQMRKCTLDLDLGFIDNKTGDVYIYEIKKSGLTRGDTYLEHFRKYLILYVFYAYAHDIAFEKLHINMLFIERSTVYKSKQKLPKDGYGYIFLEDFLERHHIELTDEEKEELFDIPIVCSENITKTVNRVEAMNEKYEGILDSYDRPAEYFKAYCKEYSYLPFLLNADESKKKRVGRKTKNTANT